MGINDLDYLTVALPKGKLFTPSADLLAQAGLSADGLEESSRKLVLVNEQAKVKFIISGNLFLLIFSLRLISFRSSEIRQKIS